MSQGKSFPQFKIQYKEVIKILENRNSNFSTYQFLRKLIGEKVDFTKHYGYSIFFTNERTKTSIEMILSTTSSQFLSIKKEKNQSEQLIWDSKPANDVKELESYIQKSLESFIKEKDTIQISITGHTAKDLKKPFGEWFQKLFIDKSIIVKVK